MGYQSISSLPESYTDDCCQWEGVFCSLTSSHVVRIFFDPLGEGEGVLWYPDMKLFAQIKELQELHLTRNGIGGLLNPEALCTLMNLKHLDLSINFIEDDMPSCLANMSSLRILKLSKNQFQGDLTIFSNLSNIEEIDVSYNLFQGLIPLSTFANLSKLSFLDLSYNTHLEVESESPTWHPSFQIQHLFLAGCNLNNRNSNRVPLFLSTQYNLQTLDLSNNFLEGAIPYQLGQLHELHSLNLSNNLLTGHIPKSFEKITSLESLDLSYNRLTGQIPQEISHMSSLTTLRLAFNDLSGRIPFEGQLSTFSESSYVGNPKLCGDPLERKCSQNTNDVNQDDGNEEKEEKNLEEDHRVIDEPLFFYSFVFMSYALGFWSVVAPLCFSRNWRKKYYTAIDGCVNYVRCSK